MRIRIVKPRGRRVDRCTEFPNLLDRLLRTDRATWAAEFCTAVDARGTPARCSSRGARSRHLNLDSSPVFSMSSAGAFTDAVGRAAALGFTDVVAHRPRASSWNAGSETVLESVAGLVPRLRSL